MKQKTIIIGISGASASGKTLLANTLLEELGSKEVIVISEDAYYKNHPHLSLEERTQTNYDHPDSLDFDLMAKHIQQMQEGKTVEIPIYSHAEHCRLPETQTIRKHAIILLEGILLFTQKKLRDMMSIRIFMDTPLDICFIRRMQRDIEERNRTLSSVIEQYEKTVRPMYLEFIEPSKQHADIIVPKGGENRIALDMIKTKIQDLLSGYIN